jgi:ubiquinone/menaquinone biosynthesis C-methylase UbiE
MKDYFSSQSKAYSTFRPTYPQALYEFIFHHVKEREVAWDCATGNGQVANYLAHYFDEVYATDISQQQLHHAIKQENIFYALSPGENTSFQDNQFDLITVAQALHWLDRDRFYREATRVGKPGATLAVWGYGLLTIDPVIDRLINEFYTETVGPYWDSARRLVENQYESISFPFKEIPTPRFAIRVKWTVDQLSGYLSSWSATQKYIQVKGKDPVPPFIKRVLPNWKTGDRVVTFPVFGRLGIIEK